MCASPFISRQQSDVGGRNECVATLNGSIVLLSRGYKLLSNALKVGCASYLRRQGCEFRSSGNFGRRLLCSCLEVRKEDLSSRISTDFPRSAKGNKTKSWRSSLSPYTSPNLQCYLQINMNIFLAGCYDRQRRAPKRDEAQLKLENAERSNW